MFFYEKEEFFVKLNDNEILRASVSINGNPFIKLDKRDDRSIEVVYIIETDVKSKTIKATMLKQKVREKHNNKRYLYVDVVASKVVAEIEGKLEIERVYENIFNWNNAKPILALWMKEAKKRMLVIIDQYWTARSGSTHHYIYVAVPAFKISYNENMVKLKQLLNEAFTLAKNLDLDNAAEYIKNALETIKGQTTL